MILVDGKALALSERAKIKATVSSLERPPVLAIITCDPNRATESYLHLKQKIATELGIETRLIVLPKEATTEEVVEAATIAAANSQGIVVQLPLPQSVDTAVVLRAIPTTHDVDNFAYVAKPGDDILPPVVQAVDLLSKIYGVVWQGKQVVVYGAGRLVGLPMAHYAKAHGATLQVVTDQTDVKEAEKVTAEADIVVLGAGKPRLLKPAMVRNGVVIFDAGASEDGGLLVGDADPAVADKASLFTPVPGGIGPLTIACLFKNLLTLATRQ